MLTPYIDLHTHSKASDGSLPPKELVALAKESGLSAIALSDHDTTDGIDEATEAAKQLGIELIPAIEFSVVSDTETHIIGLFIEKSNQRLRDAIERSQIQRRDRAKITSQKLAALGFDCPCEEALDPKDGNVIGRAHFAKLMVKKGYVSSVKEAFDRYLASGKPAYVGGHVITDREAIEIIHEAGGVAVLCHPHLIRLSDSDLYVYMQKLKCYGLDAVEGYYTEFTPEMESTFRYFARKLGLLLSGGSDFHGANKPTIAIGTGYGNLKIPYTVLSDLKECAKKYRQ
ncbi:MAG: PHP domain-containing protein [Clostridia bacterium]|nr:PHP domain-containing protein [Clostridia bacterium]